MGDTVKEDCMKPWIAKENLDIVFRCRIPLFDHPDVFLQVFPHGDILSLIIASKKNR
jgi:hypothetical protein